jgi:type I restriction-modification system DNA methylase subunit
MARKTPEKSKSNGANVGCEAELWRMADARRGSMDAGEYKHVVLGLIFLKHILAKAPFNLSNWRGDFLRQTNGAST